MNVDRRLPDGTRHKEEVTNKSQIYVNFFWTKSNNNVCSILLYLILN